ncbi:hypothetical protein DKX38_029736 [Salix brachista]|uniref:Protein HGH1 C-terminal domain-containing protein n=1 Tax=Salix brachista TaxID=2182728 RepID=A0A5N5IZX3_9ROSI|nr:hypothetical protein DKX38_029736 [Salix brachista]
MATELEELVGFLSSPSPPVKKAAVEIVRDLTGSEDGLLSLSKHASTVLPSLSQLLKDKKVANVSAFSYLLEDAKCSRKRGTTFIPALQCVASLACGGTVQMIARLQFCISRVIIAEALINLSLNFNLAAKMVEMGMIKTAMDVLYKPDSSITRLLVMLLVNLTQLDSGIVSLLQIEDEKMQRLFVMKLVRSFCRSSDETRGLFCFLSTSIFYMIYSEEDASKMPLELGNVLSFEREPWNDPEIRVEALESIYLITVQEAGLRAFWSVNGPCILQVGYEDEEDPQVMEAYELVGSLVCRFSLVWFMAVRQGNPPVRHQNDGPFIYDPNQIGTKRLSLSAAGGMNIVPVKFIEEEPFLVM